MQQAAARDQIRAILFDMDGLIVDTEPIHFQAFRRYLQRWGVDLPESVMPQFIGFTERDNLRDLKASYKLEEPLDRMVSERRAIYMELARVLPIKVFPGFWEFTRAARQLGLKLAVVSSAAGEQVAIVLGRLFETQTEGSPESYFDAIVTGDDVPRNKPHPDIYLEGARRLGVPVENCLALEDSPPGVQSATAAGMAAIAIPNEYTHDLEFPGALAVVESLEAARRYLGW